MTLKLPIYLDHHATTPVDPRVLQAMLPFFTEVFGNAASRNHSFGWNASEAVEEARAAVAAGIGADRREIVFTSGATESNNLALKGALEIYKKKGRHLVVTRAEHRSVLDTARRLEGEGCDVTFLSVDRCARVDPEAVRAALRPDTVLVSVLLASNEVGTLNPVAEIGTITRERGILLHTDATQAVGKVDVDVDALGADLLSFSAHKLYGPKGAAALFVRRRRSAVRLTPLLDGGGHERGLRSGTLNVPAIVGFGKAVALALEERDAESARLFRLRERLLRGIVGRLDGVTLNGHPTERLAGNLNLSFGGVDASSLLASLPDIAVSSGSACSSAEVEPSHVLLAMGLDEDRARSSIRFGLGRFNTEEEIDYAADLVVRAVLDGRARPLRCEETG